MRLLVTGATGFLGSHLVKQFLQDGHQIAVLKRQRSDLYRLQDCLTDLELFDTEAGLAPIFASGSLDGVIHLATCYGRNAETAVEIFETNTAFPLQLLQAAAAANVPMFINTDTSLDKYLNPYSLSKRHFAEWGKWMAQQGRINFLNIRLEHMYGPEDDSSKFTSHVIRSLCNNVAEINLTKGEQLRDFIYIDDVLSAYQVLLSRLAQKVDTRFIECDLGSGEPVRIRDFVELVHELTGSKTVLNFGAVPYRAGEVMHAQADITYLNQLGWKVTTSLAEGIKKNIANEKK